MIKHVVVAVSGMALVLLAAGTADAAAPREVSAATPPTAYIANAGSGTVTPISTVTNTAGKPIKIGNGPAAIAITPDGKTVYVANTGSGTVTPISTATNTAGKPIKVGDGPEAIAITPDGKTAYVVDFAGPVPANRQAGGSVTPISTATNTAGKPIKVGQVPQAIAITP
jgi:YVTN family beta-propeller protein